MDRFRLRTPLGRAAGLGSTKSGFGHWWTERMTAVTLVPLTAWLAAVLVAGSGSGHADVVVWLSSPSTALLMILLLAALFGHTALGLQVLIEDYVHSGVRIWALVAVRFACAALAVAGTIAVLHIGSMQ